MYMYCSSKLECLKLIASPRFTDKRVGYLGAMLLLDERTDVHLLVTNSLKNDLNHSTVYVVSLALCTLGSICSAEMSRDLAADVERLIKSSYPYLRKKATLCAFQMIRKVPDLMEMFIPCTLSLLNEKNHGVLLASVCLIQEMCERSPDVLAYFRKHMVPTLIRTLRNLILLGYSPDHDVNGVSDPFLQVKILRLMRIIGRGDRTTSEAMNDVLTQVATNTDTGRNVGHAILYEIVLTIMGIEADPGLRVLAINILGRFLLNPYKDIRYVALNTLLRVVHTDSKSVQRHRGTILDCLKDPDVSIQRRAIDLCFALINGSNTRAMVKELLMFLEHCDVEFKSDLCSKLVSVIEKYAPNKQWHMETLMNLLITAGDYARDDVVSSLVALISQNQVLHLYATRHLYNALRSTSNQQPLVQVAAWVIGEYGDLLVSDCVDTMNSVTEVEVIDLLCRALTDSMATIQTKQMILTALVKLTTRFAPTYVDRLREIIHTYTTSLQLELQQRALEYSEICTQPCQLRAGLLDYIPVTTPRVVGNDSEPTEITQPCESAALVNESNDRLLMNGTTHAQEPLTILDLLGTATPEAHPTHISTTTNSTYPTSTDVSTDTNRQNPSNLLDLLDLFAPSTNTSQTREEVSFISSGKSKTSTQSSSPIHKNNTLDLSAELSELGLTVHTQATFAPPLTVYNTEGLKILFHFNQPQTLPNETRRQLTICLVATATGPYGIDAFEFQAAVPKWCQLQLSPPSSHTIQPGLLSPPLTQNLKVWFPPKSPLRMRVRLQFVCNGVSKNEQIQLDNFPAVLWQ